MKNGHSFKELLKNFKKIRQNQKPNVMIINTIKSKGIKEFENDPVWHARKISNDDVLIGKKRLEI